MDEIFEGCFRLLDGSASEIASVTDALETERTLIGLMSW